MFLWDLTSGEVLHTYEFRSEVSAIVVANEGDTLVVALKDRLVSVRVSDGSSSGELQVPGQASGMALASTNNRIALSVIPSKLVLMDTVTLAVRYEVDLATAYPVDDVQDMEVVGVDDTLGCVILGNRFGGDTIVWDIAGCTISRKWRPHEYTTKWVALGDGRLLTVGNSGDLKIWDLASGKVKQEIVCDKQRVVDAVAVGNGVLLSFHVGGMHLWQGGARQLDTVVPKVPITAICALNSPSSVITGSADGQIAKWSTESWRSMCEFPVDGGHSGGVTAWAVSDDHLARDSIRIASGDSTGTVCVWDAEVGKLLYSLRGPSHPVRAILAFESCKMVIAGFEDGSVFVWTGENHPRLQYQFSCLTSITCLDFRREDNELAVGCIQGTVSFWRFTKIATRVGSVTIGKVPTQLSLLGGGHCAVASSHGDTLLLNMTTLVTTTVFSYSGAHHGQVLGKVGSRIAHVHVASASRVYWMEGLIGGSSTTFVHLAPSGISAMAADAHSKVICAVCWEGEVWLTYAGAVCGLTLGRSWSTDTSMPKVSERDGAAVVCIRSGRFGLVWVMRPLE
ncbi:MAG: WD40 repeat domain-containing protein [Planctomycetes bacterium]|nr:WD40 repeat domain-containing protein [Planctomycetota bacterium]